MGLWKVLFGAVAIPVMAIIVFKVTELMQSRVAKFLLLLAGLVPLLIGGAVVATGGHLSTIEGTLLFLFSVGVVSGWMMAHHRSLRL